MDYNCFLFGLLQFSKATTIKCEATANVVNLASEIEELEKDLSNSRNLCTELEDKYDSARKMANQYIQQHKEVSEQLEKAETKLSKLRTEVRTFRPWNLLPTIPA